jgi:hypothetical protein
MWSPVEVEEDLNPAEAASMNREERTLRMWFNSIGCKTHCRSLFGVEVRGLRSGVGR